MKVQSFLASSAASLPYIAQQTVEWAARTFFILQANPATVVITCIALVALGTAAYVFSRLRASEKNLKALNEKLDNISTGIPVSGTENENTATTLERIKLKDRIKTIEENIKELTKIVPMEEKLNTLQQNQKSTSEILIRTDRSIEVLEESEKTIKKSLDSQNSASEKDKAEVLKKVSTNLEALKIELKLELSKKVLITDYAAYKETQEKSLKMIEESFKKAQDALKVSMDLNESELKKISKKQKEDSKLVEPMNSELKLLRETVNGHTQAMEGLRASNKVQNKAVLALEKKEKMQFIYSKDTAEKVEKIVGYFKNKSETFKGLFEESNHEAPASEIKKEKRKSAPAHTIITPSKTTLESERKQTPQTALTPQTLTPQTAIASFQQRFSQANQVLSPLAEETTPTSKIRKNLFSDKPPMNLKFLDMTNFNIPKYSSGESTKAAD